jgi:hypothetical protein
VLWQGSPSIGGEGMSSPASHALPAALAERSAVACTRSPFSPLPSYFLPPTPFPTLFLPSHPAAFFFLLPLSPPPVLAGPAPPHTHT